MLGAGDKMKAEWNTTAVGWRKWDPVIMQWLKPVGDKVIEMAALREGDLVLDVATGSGEPGLTAASRVGRGRVVGIDVSEEMTKTARYKAQKLGVSNYEAKLYDGKRFPFEDATFDAVVSRFGVMFFPDMAAGVKEMHRVLKSGRRACAAVWGPQNETAKLVMRALNDGVGLPKPGPDDFNPFRCSGSGEIESLFRAAGFKDVSRAEVPVRRSYPSANVYSEYLLDMNQAAAEPLAKMSEDGRERVRENVERAMGPAIQSDGTVLTDSDAWVCSGVS